MVRLGCVALISAFTTTAAAAQTASDSNSWRIRELPAPSADRQLPVVEIAPNSRFGFGMFGIKSGTARNRAVIVRDVTAPRQRRAGVGLSLKF